MNYINATLDNLDEIYDLVQKTIKIIYPKYYPKGIVDFFCEHHNKTVIKNDIVSGKVRILLDNTTIIGTGSYIDNHITRLYVLDEFQRKGYGSYIMNRLEKEISKNYDVVYLDASLPATHLYEVLGYEIVSHEKHLVNNGEMFTYEIMKKEIPVVYKKVGLEKIEKCKNYKNCNISFDPDSSPKAWKFYQKMYTNEHLEKLKYDIDNPSFFTYCKTTTRNQRQKNSETQEWHNYVDTPNRNGINRLYGLLLEKNPPMHDEKLKINYYAPCLRLSGEVDFNFNDKHFPFFESLIRSEKRLLATLEDCKNMHHDLLNFSLMQTMGNLQGFKGKFCSDRMDRFVFFLNKYYQLDKFEKENTPIIKNASEYNRKALSEYLDSFKDVYEYCKIIYFVDKEFTEKLIVNGEKEMNNANDVERYMSLANQYWEIKLNVYKNRMKENE